LNRLHVLAGKLSLPGWRSAILIVLGCLLALAGFFSPQVVAGQSAVTLLRFTATGRVNNILVEWETATEFDNAGFFVWTSDAENGTYNLISNFIEAQGDGVTGAVYGFVDADVETGVIKYYKLEAVALDQTSEFFGPQSAVPVQVASTQTSTPTTTLTVTQTEGGLVPTSTVTATQVLSPQTATQTLIATSEDNETYPQQPTATLNPAAVLNSQGTAYPDVPTPLPPTPYPDQAFTATLPPQNPGLQVTVSPTSATEPTQQATLMVEGTNEGKAIGGAAPRNEDTGGLQLPPFTALLVILLIWAILAGWFYVSVRQLG